MLIQYPRYKFYFFIFLLFNTFIFCNNKYVSDWGDFSIENKSLTIKNQEIIDAVNRHIVYINSIFGNIKKTPFTIIISNKDKKLYNNNKWNWSLGITRDNTIIIKDTSKSHITKSRFIQVLQHELNHLYLNRLSVSVKVPRWFGEGFSMHYANEDFLSNKLIIANNIKKNDMFNIEIMDNRFNSNSKKQFNFAYAYSQILVNGILEMFSEKILVEILNDIKSGDKFEDAFYKNTLLTVNDYNKKIFNQIKSKFWWLKFMKFPSLLLILAPLLTIVGFIIVKIRNKKVISKWDIEEELEKNCRYDENKE